MLHEFVTANAQEIIARARAKVVLRARPLPTEDELKNGVPLFLSQLVALLRIAAGDSGAIGESAAQHGAELLAMGFSVGQVVHGYGDVCQVITELAHEKDAPITVEEFQRFNLCLDDAIASAVTEYERRRDESAAYQGAERMGALAHELRNKISAGMLAFSVLQEGTVAIGGSTGAVLGRSLRGLRDLVNNALADVRLQSGLGQRRRVTVSELIREVEVEASLEAHAGGYVLAVSAGSDRIEIAADPQLLSAALANLLQNAFKFSHANGHVSLRATATADRVLIEVEDECGGLPPGKAEDLFRPFEQRSAKRTGLGLGLSISRKGVEAMGGTLSVRDLPGKGCVFAVELPRLPDSMLAKSQRS